MEPFLEHHSNKHSIYLGNNVLETQIRFPRIFNVRN